MSAPRLPAAPPIGPEVALRSVGLHSSTAALDPAGADASPVADGLEPDDGAGLGLGDGVATGDADGLTTVGVVQAARRATIAT
jgi:hypothetical protein